MPVKSKLTAKTDAVKAKPGSVKPAKRDSVQVSAKAAGKALSAKTQSASNSKTPSKPVERVAPFSKKAAAVPTQKHETVKKIEQPRIIMAPSSVKKAATSGKVAVKPAATKPAAKLATGKNPVVAHKAAPVKTAGAKPAAAKPVIKASAAPVAPAALAAAQVQAQRQAAQKPAAGRAMPAAVASAPGQKISQSAAAPAAVAAAVATPKDLALKAQQAQLALASKKPVSARNGFKTNEWIVYPAHGVGRIVAIEEQEIAGMALELFVITFEKDKMTLRVPTGKSTSVGMRKLAEDGVVKRAMETLKGKARIKRTMWSRRAQEFEQKINSGDLVSIAEVVRDLFRAESQPEQSYSERQLYEAALDRMAREIAAVEKIDERGAVQRVTEVLAKSAKSRRAEAGEAAAAASGDIKAA